MFGKMATKRMVHHRVTQKRTVDCRKLKIPDTHAIIAASDESCRMLTMAVNGNDEQ